MARSRKGRSGECSGSVDKEEKAEEKEGRGEGRRNERERRKGTGRMEEGGR